MRRLISPCVTGCSEREGRWHRALLDGSLERSEDGWCRRLGSRVAGDRRALEWYDARIAEW